MAIFYILYIYYNGELMYNIGDIVLYKRVKDNLLYKIKEFNNGIYILYGINNRQVVVCNIEDLIKVDEIYIQNILKKEETSVRKLFSNIKHRKTNRYLFGRVLHIDGDKELLDKCLSLYKDLGVSAIGVCLKEEQMYIYIEEIIKQVTPDIIVITGHDQYNGGNIKDLDNYKNSNNFIKTIRIIRKSFSDVVIIAGACGSHFEALIGSGANIASSPKRLNTHTYDPAIAAIKVATTPYDARVDFKYIYKYIENGKDALGGIETNGKMRLLL